MRRLGYLVVEGPTGVGKNRLARRLSTTFGSGLILEQSDENPFLERFYLDRHKYALPTQLSFLFDRIRRLDQLRQVDMFHRHWIVNFFLERDLLFAELVLDFDEFQLYRHVYDKLAPKITPPGLIVFLQAEVSTLEGRLQARRRPDGFSVPRDHLAEVVDSYTRFFLQYNSAPILIVNTEGVDFINREEDYRQLVEYLPTIKNGRHFFNPMTRL
ncbi:MAG: deoxynucleoside kinase [Acidiferrobacteraceae bacterium]|nr:deoxynucleoside kinase [Acidiferrobacteraceae bacterium]